MNILFELNRDALKLERTHLDAMNHEQVEYVLDKKLPHQPLNRILVLGGNY